MMDEVFLLKWGHYVLPFPPMLGLLLGGFCSMEGSRSCLGLVRSIWMSWASRCYQGLIAKVTSWMPMSLHWESHPSDVFQRLWLKIFSAQRLILPQKRLSAIFINPGHNLRLLSPVTIYCGWFSAQICPQAVILAYKNISSSPQKRSKKTSEDNTLEIKWARIKCYGRNVSSLSHALHNYKCSAFPC